LASINARRIFSITVISVFIAVRLSRVPAHCSSLLESPFERTVRCRAVFRMASYARFRWTASSVNVSRSMIMMCRSLARPGSETGAMIGAMPRPRTRPAPCRGAAHTGAPVPRAVPFTSRKLGALAARGPGAAGGGAARQMTCRPPLAEVGSKPGGDRANVRRRARGGAAAQGAPELSVQAEDIHAPPGVHGRTDRLDRQRDPPPRW